MNPKTEMLSKLEAKPSISVCMATYNGQKFVLDQIKSILPQLTPSDELVIQDDHSTDDTVEIIRRINDHRIRLIQRLSNGGVNLTFQGALQRASNSIIFLSDQDDLWLPNRVSSMLEPFKDSSVLLVTSNSEYMDHLGRPVTFPIRRKRQKESNATILNLSRILLGVGNYPGCAMALRRSLLDIVLPFPEYIESHDLFIASAAIILGGNHHLESSTLRRRIHGQNSSLQERALYKKFVSRVILLRSLALLGWRTRLWNDKATAFESH